MTDQIEPLSPDEELPEGTMPPEPPETISDDDLGRVENKQLQRQVEEKAEREEKQGKRRKKGPTRKTIQRQKMSREMSYEEWVDAIETKVGWQNPGVEVKLERIQPEWHKGLKVGGLLDSRECAPFSQKEVMERFGGGTYQIIVTGPRSEPGLPPVSYKKRFSCAGIPRVDEGVNPDSGVGTQYKSPHEHEVERGAVGHLGNLTEQLLTAQLSGDRRGGDSPLLERSFQAFKQLTDERAKAREDAAMQARQDAEVRYEQAKAETERLRVEMEQSRREMERKNSDTRNEMNNVLTSMLPTFNDNASRQVQHMMATFQAREERIETQHAKEIESLQRNHGAALQQAEMLRQAELQRIEAMFTNQLGIVQAELTSVKSQLEGERAENRKLREEIMKNHTEQLTRFQQEQDPIANISKYAQVVEVAKEFIPSLGGGGDGPGLSDDAPDYMKLISQVASSFGPAISQVLQARQEGQMQPQLTPEQAMAIQQQRMMMQAQQQAQQHQAPQGPPQLEPPQKVTVSKGEMEKAMTLLATVKTSGTSASDAAAAAMQHINQGVLKAVAARSSGAVVSEIERHGLLPAVLSDEEGRAYLVEVLKTLRTLTSKPGTSE